METRDQSHPAAPYGLCRRPPWQTQIQPIYCGEYTIRIRREGSKKKKEAKWEEREWELEKGDIEKEKVVELGLVDLPLYLCVHILNIYIHTYIYPYICNIFICTYSVSTRILWGNLYAPRSTWKWVWRSGLCASPSASSASRTPSSQVHYTYHLLHLAADGTTLTYREVRGDGTVCVSRETALSVFTEAIRRISFYLHHACAHMSLPFPRCSLFHHPLFHYFRSSPFFITLLFPSSFFFSLYRQNCKSNAIRSSVLLSR